MIVLSSFSKKCPGDSVISWGLGNIPTGSAGPIESPPPSSASGIPPSNALPAARLSPGRIEVATREPVVRPRNERRSSLFDMNLSPAPAQVFASSSESLFEVANYPKAVVRIPEVWRNAGPRGATAYLDVVAPGAPARGAPLPGRRTLGITLPRAGIVIL